MALQPGLFNITTATDTTLVEQRSQRGSLNFINIANINTEIIKISLYLDDGTNQTYFFKNNFLYPGERLTLDKGINFDDYKKRFDVDISQLYSDAISKHLKTGLLEKTETSLKLSSKGLLLANELFVDLLPENDSHLINKPGD